ncbi:MAG: NADH-quinone oxidoreductase subunit NuoE [Armatimonadota bacterium]
MSTKSAIRGFEKERGNLIPMLHAVQDAEGYVSARAMDEIAEWLGIPVSEVYGTATFYTLFALKPRGKNVVRLCDSPPCHIEGSKWVRQAVEAHLGIKAGETTPDGLFTIEMVSCLGLCGVSPAMMVNDDVYGNLIPEMMPGILAKYREE